MQKIVVANYKMNGSKSFYASAFKKINNTKVKDTEIVLCPPFVYLNLFKLKKKNIHLGSQDISLNVGSKSTGQISPAMLKEFKVKYAIIGHSEQRELGETDEQIAQKAKLCMENNIIPIVCVGEKNKNSSVKEVLCQVEKVFSQIDNTKLFFAYEPVWAIGSGEVPTKEKINSVVSLIKQTCNSKCPDVKVLYGGSVNAKNYKDLLKSEADGFLIGGASLKIDEFCEIVKGVENE